MKWPQWLPNPLPWPLHATAPLGRIVCRVGYWMRTSRAERRAQREAEAAAAAWPRTYWPHQVVVIPSTARLESVTSYPSGNPWTGADLVSAAVDLGVSLASDSGPSLSGGGGDFGGGGASGDW